MVVKRISKLKKRNGISLVRSMFKNGIKPEIFGWDDVAQQIFGAILFSAPFVITEEVWKLSKALDPLRIFLIVLFTVFISANIIYYTKFQKVAKESIGGEFEAPVLGRAYIPKRLVSLLLISYATTFSVLWIFGIVGTQITDPLWISKLVVFTSFFASIGAATADIIK
jgi:uncharacterized membrane protein